MRLQASPILNFGLANLHTITTTITTTIATTIATTSSTAYLELLPPLLLGLQLILAKNLSNKHPSKNLVMTTPFTKAVNFLLK